MRPMAPASDEPYLWTAFFKIDGDTIVLDLIGADPMTTRYQAICYLSGTVHVRDARRVATAILATPTSTMATTWPYRRRWESMHSR